MEDTSESFGLPATADFMAALITNDELDATNQVMVKQLKNRYRDWRLNTRFCVGINRAKMKLTDVEQQDMELVNQISAGKTVGEVDIPLFDNTTAGKKISVEGFTI